jgi:hypothetical protein
MHSDTNTALRRFRSGQNWQIDITVKPLAGHETHLLLRPQGPIATSASNTGPKISFGCICGCVGRWGLGVLHVDHPSAIAAAKPVARQIRGRGHSAVAFRTNEGERQGSALHATGVSQPNFRITGIQERYWPGMPRRSVGRRPELRKAARVQVGKAGMRLAERFKELFR